MKKLAGRSVLHLALVVLAVLVTGCASPQVNVAVPTVASMFLAPAAPAAGPSQPITNTVAGAQPTVLPTVVITASVTSTPAANATALPTTIPTADATGTPPAATPIAASRPATQTTELPVFDDSLNADWSTAQTEGVTFVLTDTTHAYSSTTGIAVTPVKDGGRFFLAVRKEAKQQYGSDHVYGLSFFLNSGSHALDPTSLAVTILGSDANPYWVANDTSVKVDDKYNFSETTLNFLGINRTIPPNTWVEIDVYLDKLLYEPSFKYLTGIYIKNANGFRNTYYVDRIHLLATK